MNLFSGNPRRDARFRWLARGLPVVAAMLAFCGTAIAEEGSRAQPANAKASASANTPLDSYFEGLETLRASFTQTVKDARGKEVDRTTGTLVVSRPGKFRWEVSAGEQAAGQLLVADGRNVWFFDKDLEQVTVKPADAALSSTPAMLLSGGTKNIRESFTFTPAGTREGLEWVLVEPRQPEADFRRALFGFGTGGSNKGTLQRMIIDDRLGQTANIEFESVKRNAPVSPEEVSFTPPPGVDVIGTPVVIGNPVK